MNRPDIRSDEAREPAVAWCLQVANGPLTADEQAAFQAWLREDPRHQVRFDEAVAIWQAAEDQAFSADMIGLRAQALDSLRQANRRRWRRGPGVRAFAAMAAAVVVVCAGVWLHWAPDVYATGIGERQVVALEDGSKVSLDADTEVRVRYVGDRRELWLERGRASFTVAHDPLRPFSVEAAGKTVVATGTRFSVERLGREVRVVLFEGRVVVLEDRPDHNGAPTPVRIAGTAPAAEQGLRPGGELVIATETGAASLVEADMGRSLAWEGGELVFADEPLARAIARVNRYADQPVTVGDAAAGQVRISGVFNAGDVPAFVEGVTAAFPVEARTTATGVVLSHENSADR